MAALPLVEVSWRDSTRIEDGWQDRDYYAAKLTPPNLRCRTVGYLVEDTDVGVVIANTVNTANGDVVGVIAIPRGCIGRVRRL